MVPTKPDKCKISISARRQYLKLKKSWSKDACKQNYELIPLNCIIWTTLFSNVQFNFKVCLQYYIHTPELQNTKSNISCHQILNKYYLCLFVAEHGAERDSGVPLPWAVCEKQLRQDQPISPFLVINYITFAIIVVTAVHTPQGHGHLYNLYTIFTQS